MGEKTGFSREIFWLPSPRINITLNILFAHLTTECLRPAKLGWGKPHYGAGATTPKPTGSMSERGCISVRGYRARCSGCSAWSEVILYLAGLGPCSVFCPISDWQQAKCAIEVQLEKGVARSWGDSCDKKKGWLGKFSEVGPQLLQDTAGSGVTSLGMCQEASGTTKRNPPRVFDFQIILVASCLKRGQSGYYLTTPSCPISSCLPCGTVLLFPI